MKSEETTMDAFPDNLTQDFLNKERLLREARLMKSTVNAPTAARLREEITQRIREAHENREPFCKVVFAKDESPLVRRGILRELYERFRRIEYRLEEKEWIANAGEYILWRPEWAMDALEYRIHF
jgi:hypothetical protein